MSLYDKKNTVIDITDIIYGSIDPWLEQLHFIDNVINVIYEDRNRNEEVITGDFDQCNFQGKQEVSPFVTWLETLIVSTESN